MEIYYLINVVCLLDSIFEVCQGQWENVMKGFFDGKEFRKFIINNCEERDGYLVLLNNNNFFVGEQYKLGNK